MNLSRPTCDPVRWTHLAQVTTIRPLRSLFRKRYLVRCWDCTLRLGPFTSFAQARDEQHAANSRPCQLNEVTVVLAAYAAQPARP